MDQQKSTKKILLVEDEKYLSDLYTEVLSSAGFNVTKAEDGEAALTAMTAGGYDLVLLDIMLPKMDGLQVLTKLQEKPPQNPNKVIVILTNLDQQEVIAKGIALGVKGYFLKADYTPDKMVSEVNRYLE